MKTMTAAMAVVGCAAAWPVCAGQAIDRAVSQVQSISSNAVVDTPVPGLLGAYPASREASGTSWQPDSTQDDQNSSSAVISLGADRLTGSGNNRFSLLGNENNTVLATRRLAGTGTVGLQSTFSIDPFAVATVYPGGPEMVGHDPVLVGGGYANNTRWSGLAASYSLPVGMNGSLFGYFGAPGEPALGPPVSYMRRFSGIDTPEVTRASHWLDSTASGSRVFTVGYAWRGVKLEGSAFSGREPDQQPQIEKESFKLDSASTRLSFNPSPNWSFQLSRGSISGLDQLEPDEDIRRTTVSATYNRAFDDGNWQSTLAWGRNARKSREPAMGFLLESTLRFSGGHAVFGRLEQVGSEEPARENEARQASKLNRLTVGYFHDMGLRGLVKLDAGVFASRYSAPSNAISSYSNEPTQFMLFIRLKLQ